MFGSRPVCFPLSRSLLGPLLGLGVLLAGCHGAQEATPSAVDVAGSRAAGEPEPQLLEAVFPGRDPSLQWDEEGHLHLVYVEDGDEGPSVVYRRLGPAPAGPFPVSLPAAQVSSHGEVPPVLAILPGGTLVVAYTVSLPGRFKGEIRVQRSTDGGGTWSAPILLHDDGEVGSHSFLDVAVTGRGEAFFSWLDNRTGDQGVRVAFTSDGQTFAPNRSVDSQVCQCCRTALLSDEGERLWLAYRDLEPPEVRDIAVVRSGDGGRSFEPPVTVSADGWTLNACPHTGPRLALDSEGTLWITWFSGREPGVYVAPSRDGGRTFGSRERLAAPGDEVQAVAHPEIGLLPDGLLAVLYEAVGEDGRRWLEARFRTGDSGGWGGPVVLAFEASYPRLATRHGRAALAWTERWEGETRVRVSDWRSVFRP